MQRPQFNFMFSKTNHTNFICLLSPFPHHQSNNLVSNALVQEEFKNPQFHFMLSKTDPHQLHLHLSPYPHHQNNNLVPNALVGEEFQKLQEVYIFQKKHKFSLRKCINFS